MGCKGKHVLYIIQYLEIMIWYQRCVEGSGQQYRSPLQYANIRKS